MNEKPLYDVAYHLVRTPPASLVHGDVLLLAIELTNTGQVPWMTYGQHPVRLSYRWNTADGQPAVLDGLRSLLPAPVPPGLRVLAELRVESPPQPGDYHLVVDLVEEGFGWFSERAVLPLTLPVSYQPVTMPRATIINGNCIINDAVGGHVVSQLKVLREAGYQTLLITEHIDNRLPADIRRSAVAIKLAAFEQPDENIRWIVDHFFASDVVIVNYSTYYDLALLIQKAQHSAVIFDYHGVTPPSLWDPNSPGYTNLVLGQDYLKLVEYADLGFGHSPFTSGELLATGLIPPGRVSVQPYAVINPSGGRCGEPDEPDEPAQQGETVSDIIRRYDLAGKHVLLYIGRMARNKRIRDLVEALALVLQQHPDTVLLLVGENQFGPYRDYANEVMQRARECGCEQHVIFTGQVPDLEPYYCLCTVFVTASIHEGFCMPAVEAMAHGKPVVAPAVTALPATIGGGGLLCEAENPADFAAKVVSLLGEGGAKGRLSDALTPNPSPWGRGASEPSSPAGRRGRGDEGIFAGRPIVFVTPRYGQEIVGGAERLIRGWAEHLAAQGYAVEALTTCVIDMSRWQDDYPPGVEYLNGVTVRRFPVDRVDPSVFHHIQSKAMAGAYVGYRDECTFIQNSLYSTALNDYLRSQADTIAAALFAPYLFGTTYYGMQAVPGKAIVVPCLHDEPAAHFAIFREMLEMADGIFYNAQAECDFATRSLNVLNPFHAVAGYGFAVDGPPGDGRAFRARHGLPDFPEPVMLYSGRVERGKNVPLLFEYFMRYKEEHPGPLTLVLTGKVGDDIEVPERDDVVALGVLDEAEMPGAFAAASVLCQPSLNESFSIVMMESWLQNRPVLVHAECDVTSSHVYASDGGMLFSDYACFRDALDRLCGDPAFAEQAGQRGRDYVVRTYSWEVLTEHILRHIAAFTAPRSTYAYLAQRGIRRSLDFTHARFHDALLEVVERAQAETGVLFNRQEMAQLQQLTKVGLPDYTIHSGLPVVGSLVAWVRRNMTSHLKEPYLDPVIQRQEAFNQELLQTLVPTLEQSLYEQRRLRREVELLREQVNAGASGPAQANRPTRQNGDDL